MRNRSGFGVYVLRVQDPFEGYRLRICSGQGCLRVVPNHIRYCDECIPAMVTDDGIRSHSNAYDELLDKLRKSLRWQQLRARVIREQPICARCDMRISEIADHIVPAREAVAQVQASGKYLGDKYRGYFIRENIQGLCRKCHGIKTLEDKAHVGQWPSVLAMMRPIRRRFAF